MLGGLETLVVQHLADRAGVGADRADLSVDGERHGLLGDEEGQRAADESEEDDGEQAELERAAHKHFHRVTGPGQENGPVAGGRPARRVPGGAARSGGSSRWTPPGSVSTPAVGHDTITNTVRVAMVHSE